jgi:hypothetical protein
MIPLMVKEADLNRIDVPEDYEVLDATALGRRLGFKRDTVLAYLSRRNFGRIPRPNRQLYVSCQVCKLPPAWFRTSYPAINCGCFGTSSLRSSFAKDPALK